MKYTRLLKTAIPVLGTVLLQTGIAFFSIRNFFSFLSIENEKIIYPVQSVSVLAIGYSIVLTRGVAIWDKLSPLDEVVIHDHNILESLNRASCFFIKFTKANITVNSAFLTVVLSYFATDSILDEFDIYNPIILYPMFIYVMLSELITFFSFVYSVAIDNCIYLSGSIRELIKNKKNNDEVTIDRLEPNKVAPDKSENPDQVVLSYLKENHDNIFNRRAIIKSFLFCIFSSILKIILINFFLGNALIRLPVLRNFPAVLNKAISIFFSITYVPLSFFTQEVQAYKYFIKNNNGNVAQKKSLLKCSLLGLHYLEGIFFLLTSGVLSYVSCVNLLQELGFDENTLWVKIVPLIPALSNMFSDFVFIVKIMNDNIERKFFSKSSFILFKESKVGIDEYKLDDEAHAVALSHSYLVST